MKKRVRSNQSSLHKDTLAIVRECFPHEKILEEEVIRIDNKTLYIDIYLPKQRIAFECDGEQHFAYSQFFHGSLANYKEQQKNDALKEAYCKIEGINLIRIKYNEKIDKDILVQKVLDSLNKEE